MKHIEKMKLNDEVIDGLCSFFKGASTLIEQNKEFATLYAYLLLQATGIERLQKIVFILEYYEEHGKHVTDKNLRTKMGHGILNIHKNYFKKYFHDHDKAFNEKALLILTELVNVKDGYRYINFNLHNEETFSVHDHVVKILELDGLDYSNINDLIRVSWEIVDIILRKYVSILVNLIWHKDVGNRDVLPICLSNYVLKGWQAIDLTYSIDQHLDTSREEKR